MTHRRHNAGVTLVELIVVVAVLVLLAGMTIRLTRGLDNRSKENTLANTFAVLKVALEQFRDFGYSYRGADYSRYVYPLDCTDFTVEDLRTVLGDVLGLDPNATTVEITNHERAPGDEYREYSGCEVMYWLLSQVPDARETLKGIHSSLVTNENGARKPVSLQVGTRSPEPFLRVLDPWGTTLQYDYYDVATPDLKPLPETERNFPVLISAGPDRVFGTADDISSKVH